MYYQYLSVGKWGVISLLATLPLFQLSACATFRLLVPRNLCQNKSGNVKIQLKAADHAVNLRPFLWLEALAKVGIGLGTLKNVDKDSWSIKIRHRLPVLASQHEG